MGLSAVTYALCKKFTKQYVEETAAQFGALKGASCTIKSIVKQNGQSVVTFEWKNNEGETRESVMYVDDGTPIYVWTPNFSYKYGDLAIYGDSFYRCITPNSDASFDSLKWNPIGSPDGDYDIVQSADYLPQRFTPADRKMYYCIDNDCFYLWDGEKWSPKTSVYVNETMFNKDESGKLSINTVTDSEIDNLFNEG